MDSSFVVRYRNEIASSQRRLTLIERRILTIAISQIPQDRPVGPTELFCIRASDLTWLGSDKAEVYLQMREAAARLMSRQITLLENPSTGQYLTFRIVQAVDYRPQEGVIELCFGAYFLPFVTQLRQEFTFYQVEDTIGFRSTYTQPFYSHCMRFMHEKGGALEVRKTGSFRITVEDFRKMMGIDEGKLTSYSNLKIKVISVVIRQINESSYTKLRVTLAGEEKQGRKVWRLWFKLARKAGRSAPPSIPIDSDVIDSEVVELEQKPERTFPRPKTLPERLSRDQATLTEKQLPMWRDKLCRDDVNCGYVATSFISFLYNNSFVPYGAFSGVGTDKKLKAFVEQKLRDQSFVQAIWPNFLKRLGFIPRKKK